jgi:hypothetical protein
MILSFLQGLFQKTTVTKADAKADEESAGARSHRKKASRRVTSQTGAEGTNRRIETTE